MLVTSYDPLTIFVYPEGLVRFATQPYSTRHKGSRFAHLTNFSVNRKSKNYQYAKRDEDGDNDQDNSSKWSLRQLRAYFSKAAIGDFEVVWTQIKDMITKTCLSVENILSHNLNRAGNGRKLCFELFGFDVILDHNLRPWLLEVNVLPSLASSSDFDKRIKTSLMSDTFNTIGVTPYNRRMHEKNSYNYKWKRFVGLDQQQSVETGHSLLDAHSLNQPRQRPQEDGDEDWSTQQIKSGKIRPPKELQHEHWDSFSREEQLVVVELIEEYMRRGSFELVFPRASNVDQYRKYFKVPRSPNLIAWKWLKLPPEQRKIFLKDFKVRKT